jgi:hypothetical protein
MTQGARRWLLAAWLPYLGLAGCAMPLPALLLAPLDNFYMSPPTFLMLAERAALTQLPQLRRRRGKIGAGDAG